jgi:hypothetical protein
MKFKDNVVLELRGNHNHPPMHDIPLTEVQLALNVIIDAVPLGFDQSTFSKINDYYKHFKDTWLFGSFSPSIWNHYDT